MRKLIMFVFFLLSLVTMIAFTMSVGDLLSMFGLGSFEWSDITAIFENATISEILPALGAILWGLFQLYGIPLAIFLISWNGLATSKN